MNAWKQQSVTVPNDCLNFNLFTHHELQYIGLYRQLNGSNILGYMYRKVRGKLKAMGLLGLFPSTK